jgi:hypothetical protein
MSDAVVATLEGNWMSDEVVVVVETSESLSATEHELTHATVDVVVVVAVDELLDPPKFCNHVMRSVFVEILSRLYMDHRFFCVL